MWARFTKRSCLVTQRESPEAGWVSTTINLWDGLDPAAGAASVSGGGGPRRRCSAAVSCEAFLSFSSKQRDFSGIGVLISAGFAAR